MTLRLSYWLHDPLTPKFLFRCVFTPNIGCTIKILIYNLFFLYRWIFVYLSLINMDRIIYEHITLFWFIMYNYFMFHIIIIFLWFAFISSELGMSILHNFLLWQLPTLLAARMSDTCFHSAIQFPEHHYWWTFNNYLQYVYILVLTPMLPITQLFTLSLKILVFFSFLMHHVRELNRFAPP